MVVYPYNTKFIDLPGDCKIAYIDEGKGERTLLFIHGLANYALVWKNNIDYLKQYYRCIAIDLPGNGLSDKNEHDFSMRFFAECVYEFIKAMNLKDPVVIGHSMGGHIAMTLAIAHPLCLSKLVLCAPAGLEEFTSFDKTLYYSTIHLYDFVSSEEHTLRHTIENSFYHHKHQGESIVKDLVAIMKTYKLNYYRKMIESCIKGMLEEPVLDKISSITTPTLVMFGKHDALIPNRLLHHTTPEHIAKTGVQKLTNGKLEMISNCGHFLQLEKTDEVNRHIIMYLEEK